MRVQCKKLALAYQDVRRWKEDLVKGVANLILTGHRADRSQNGVRDRCETCYVQVCLIDQEAFTATRKPGVASELLVDAGYFLIHAQQVWRSFEECVHKDGLKRLASGCIDTATGSQCRARR